MRDAEGSREFACNEILAVSIEIKDKGQGIFAVRDARQYTFRLNIEVSPSTPICKDAKFEQPDSVLRQYCRAERS